MALVQELMACGLSAAVADKIGVRAQNTGLTAAGTNQATALTLTSNYSRFSTVASGTGAALPRAHAQPEHVIYNGGANALTVYPTGTETINGSASFSVTNGKSARFFPAELEWIATLSA